MKHLELSEDERRTLREMGMILPRMSNHDDT